MNLDSIRKKYGHAIIERCCQQGCEFGLKNLKNYVLLSGEKLSQKQKASDCLVFKGNGILIVAIVELKCKTVHATEVFKKLTNSTQKALEIMQVCGIGDLKSDFFHFVLATGWNRSEHKKLTSKRIFVRGVECKIYPDRCGISFPEFLRKMDTT